MKDDFPLFPKDSKEALSGCLLALIVFGIVFWLAAYVSR